MISLEITAIFVLKYEKLNSESKPSKGKRCVENNSIFSYLFLGSNKKIMSISNLKALVGWIIHPAFL